MQRRIAQRPAESDKGVRRRKENGSARRPVSAAGSTAEKTGVVVTISIYAFGEEDVLVTPLRTAI